MRPLFVAVLILALGALAAGAWMILGQNGGWFTGAREAEAAPGAGLSTAERGLPLAPVGENDPGGSAVGTAPGPDDLGTEATEGAAAREEVLLVTGRVVTREGSPPPEAQLTATCADGTIRGVECAADGSFRIEGPSGDLRRLVASAPGHAARLLRDIPMGTDLRILLEKGVAFRGRVVDPAGKPVDGAAIAVVPLRRTDLEPLEGRTSEEGRFLIENIAPGRYDVTLSKDELAPFHDPGLVIPPDGLEKDYTLISGFSFVGQVVTEEENLPVQGVQVEVVDRIIRGRSSPHQSRKLGPFTTDAEGLFRIEHLAPGELRLMLKGQGFGAEVRSFQVKSLEASEKPFVIKLKSAAGLIGRVLDPEGRPVGWARVTIEPKGGIRGARDFGDLVSFLFDAESFEDDVGRLPPAVTADGQGRYQVAGAPTGSGWVQAFDPRGRFGPSERILVKLERGKVIEKDLNLRPGFPVSGVVLDTEGRPIEDARVNIARERALTGEDGGFLLEAAPEGTQKIHVWHEDYQRWTGTVEIGEGSPAPLEIRLESGNILTGRISDRRGNPIVGASVVVTDSRRRRLGSEITDHSGFFHIGALRSEKVAVTVHAEGYFRVFMRDVPTGERPLEIQLDERPWEASGDILGSVVRAGSGVPILDFQLSGVDPRRVQIFEGVFYIQNLEPGTRSFEVRAPGFQRRRLRNIEVLPGKEIVLDPVALHRAHELRVLVRDQSGRVLRTGRVRVRLRPVDDVKNPSWALRASRPRGKARHFVFPELRRGRYRLTASLRGYHPASQIIDLRGNTTRVLTLRKRKPRRRR